MKKFWFTWFLPGALCLAVVYSMGCSPKQEDPLVSFKGGCLTVQDLDAHYDSLKKNSRYKSNPDQLTPEFVFDHALNMEMIIARGLGEKLHQDPRIRAKIHEYMSDLFLKIMQTSLVPEINKDEFTKEQLEQFYNTHIESYTTPAMLSVRMIKAGDETLARQVRQQIESKEMDFIQAAASYSEDKATASRGGDIGTRPLKKFKPDWREVISGLEPKTLSGPFQIKTRWYLFELVNKTQPVQHSFEEKKAYIRNDLLYAEYRQAWQNTYEQLKETYGVKVDQDKLDSFILERKVQGEVHSKVQVPGELESKSPAPGQTTPKV